MAETVVQTIEDLNFRSTPNLDSNNKAGLVKKDSKLRVTSKIKDIDNREWWHVDGYISASPSYTTVVEGGVVIPPIDFTKLWPLNKCLVGLHTRADGPLYDMDFEAIRVGRIEAVKLMTTSRPENVDRLRQINPDIFIMLRLHADFTNRVVRPDEFANWMKGDARPFYNKHVQYFEVHNEPNLVQEGLGRSWNNGIEFGEWYRQVIALLRRDYPDAKFGFPGVSPGDTVNGIRMNAFAFLEQCRPVIEPIWNSDWIGAHSYWVDRPSMNMFAAGQAWQDVQRKFPEKLLFITEFSNSNDQQSLVERGTQYRDYYTALRNKTGVGAAFSFVVSSSSLSFKNEVWRTEDHKLTDIPRIVAQRAF